MRGRHLFIVMPLLAALGLPPASAQVGVSVGISVPGLQIGINVPAYPELQPVPAYPVYYAPGLPANYFFYDGLYWVYANDAWYSSTWYNGPWYGVEAAVVPVYILRVPVRYYRAPPLYFRGWAAAEPPRWGAHWGPTWEAGHHGWDHWDRHAAPPPAPLPVYQRQYAGERYPKPTEQLAIRGQRYNYQPRDEQVRERVAVEARHAEHGGRGAGATPPQRPQGAAPHPTDAERSAHAEPQERQAQQQERQAQQHERQAQQHERQQHEAKQQRDARQPKQQEHPRQQSQREAQDEHRVQNGHGSRGSGERDGG